MEGSSEDDLERDGRIQSLDVMKITQHYNHIGAVGLLGHECQLPHGPHWHN